MIRRLLTFLLIAGLAIGAGSAIDTPVTVTSAIRSIPFKISAPLDSSTIKNLIEYQIVGIPDHVENNALGGKARVTEMDLNHIALQTGVGRTLTLHLLPAKNDTLLALIETIDAPQPDSKLTVYNSNWVPQPELWTAPDTGNSDKIILTEYKFSHSTNTLTVYLREAGNDSIIGQMQFVWNGKTFKRSKKK